MVSGAAQLDRLGSMSHTRRSAIFAQTLLLGSSRCGHWRSAISAYRQIDQARLELHAQAQPKLLQFVLDLVERFLTKIAILEHFRLGLLGKLPNRRDVRI